MWSCAASMCTAPFEAQHALLMPLPCCESLVHVKCPLHAVELPMLRDLQRPGPHAYIEVDLLSGWTTAEGSWRILLARRALSRRCSVWVAACRWGGVGGWGVGVDGAMHACMQLVIGAHKLAGSGDLILVSAVCGLPSAWQRKESLRHPTSALRRSTASEGSHTPPTLYSFLLHSTQRPKVTLKGCTGM
jgi:hypothetical protein